MCYGVYSISYTGYLQCTWAQVPRMEPSTIKQYAPKKYVILPLQRLNVIADYDQGCKTAY